VRRPFPIRMGPSIGSCRASVTFEMSQSRIATVSLRRQVLVDEQDCGSYGDGADEGRSSPSTAALSRANPQEVITIC